MMFLKGGIAKVDIGTETILNRCPSCEADKEVDILVTGNYFHLYYIPFFPTAKEVTLICNTCGLQRVDLPFSDRYVRNYHEIKGHYKYPVSMYLGAIIITIFIGSLIISILR